MSEMTETKSGRTMFRSGYVDLDGEPTKRTKISHPYSYDPFVLIDRRQGREVSGGAYSDRLMQWDREKHDRFVQKHFGNVGQWWSNRDADLIEAFLRDYTGHPDLKLLYVLEGANVSSGHPYWYFGWTEGG